MGFDYKNKGVSTKLSTGSQAAFSRRDYFNQSGKHGGLHLHVVSCTISCYSTTIDMREVEEHALLFSVVCVLCV